MTRTIAHEVLASVAKYNGVFSERYVHRSGKANRKEIERDAFVVAMMVFTGEWLIEGKGC